MRLTPRGARRNRLPSVRSTNKFCAIEDPVLATYDPDAEKVEWKTPEEIAAVAGIDLTANRQSKMIFLGRVCRKWFGQSRSGNYPMPKPRSEA